MKFLDNMIFTNTPDTDEEDDDITSLGSQISDRLNANPEGAVDINDIVSIFNKKKKQAPDKDGDIFSRYIDGVSTQRRLRSLKSILKGR